MAKKYHVFAFRMQMIKEQSSGAKLRRLMRNGTLISSQVQDILQLMDMIVNISKIYLRELR